MSVAQLDNLIARATATKRGVVERTVIISGNYEYNTVTRVLMVCGGRSSYDRPWHTLLSTGAFLTGDHALGHDDARALANLLDAYADWKERQ